MAALGRVVAVERASAGVQSGPRVEVPGTLLAARESDRRSHEGEDRDGQNEQNAGGH